MEIAFRPLTEADYELAESFKRATVAAVTGNESLFEAWFPAERTYGMFLARLQAFDPAGCVLVLVDGEVAGHMDMAVKMAESGPVGHLNNIYLLPVWRGKGVSAAMDVHMVGFFGKHGARWATLKTNPQRPRLVAFYERLGWRKVDEAANGMIVMGRDF